MAASKNGEAHPSFRGSNQRPQGEELCALLIELVGSEGISSADVHSTLFSLGPHTIPFIWLVPHMYQRLVEFLSSSGLVITVSYVFDICEGWRHQRQAM